jgi:hypothetical protein
MTTRPIRRLSRRPSTRRDDKVSIRRNGIIGLNRRVASDNELERYDKAILYFNRRKRSFGIEFASGSIDEHAMALSSPKGHGPTLRARNFFLTYGIDPDRIRGSYDYRKVPVRTLGIPRDGFMFIVKLPAPDLR